MIKIFFPIDISISKQLLKEHLYVLDPTKVYWYKKIDTGIEIEIQNRDNDLYEKGQVILHCKSACIIDDLYELKYILTFCEMVEYE